MKKVLIVDDDILVRVGVKSIIEWEKNGFLIIGEAADGVAALKMVKDLQPDIVLVDVVMLKMNGIELTKRIKNCYPYIRVIVLSCHNEYEYVRQAMKLGADDYLLKLSMQPENLLNILMECASKIDINEVKTVQDINENKIVIFEKQVEEAFYTLITGKGDCISSGEFLNRIIKGESEGEWRLVSISIHTHSIVGKNKVLCERTLLNYIKQLLRNAGNLFVFKLMQNEFNIFYSTSCLQDLDEKSEKELFEKMVQSVYKFVNISISAGISLSIKTADDVFEAYNQSREAFLLSFYDSGGRVYLYDDVMRTKIIYPENENTIKYYRKEIDGFKETLCYGQYEKTQEYIDHIFKIIQQRRTSINVSRQIVLEMAEIIHNQMENISEAYSVQKIDIFRRVNNTGVLKNLKKWVSDYFEEYRVLCKESITARRTEIKNLVEYLKRNYDKKIISLSWAAKFINMSEGHTSALFKSETGKNFIEFLTEIRIKKAAELIATTDKTACEVAEIVGYENVNYFGRVFKKVMGKSPSHYR